MLGGLVALGAGRAPGVWRRPAIRDGVRLSVELCAIYWHFLLLVWLVCSSLPAGLLTSSTSAGGIVS